MCVTSLVRFCVVCFFYLTQLYEMRSHSDGSQMFFCSSLKFHVDNEELNDHTERSSFCLSEPRRTPKCQINPIMNESTLAKRSEVRGQEMLTSAKEDVMCVFGMQ